MKSPLFTLSLVISFSLLFSFSLTAQMDESKFKTMDSYDIEDAIYDEVGITLNFDGPQTTLPRKDPRYTQQSPGIDFVKAFHAAYNTSDWATMEKSYGPGAKITHNNAPQRNAAEMTNSFRAVAEQFSSYRIDLGEALIIEQVIDDKGEMWVNFWSYWAGTVAATKEEIRFPVHATYQLVDGKIIEEYAYYNEIPMENALGNARKQLNPPVHFIEAWNATPAWKALSTEKQTEYLKALSGPISGMMESGVEILSWGSNTNATDQRAGYDFFAVWSFPNAEMVKTFEQAVAGSGWYTYFEQMNISGKAETPRDVMGRLIGMH